MRQAGRHPRNTPYAPPMTATTGRLIQNPILNSPFREPTRHFEFNADGITDRVVEGRRKSAYFIPVPQPRKKGGEQLSLVPSACRTG